jgi:Zn finger protein HypA/HybF involved in hydrogenase expression
MPDETKAVMCPQCKTMMEAIRPYCRVTHTIPDQYSQFRNRPWFKRVGWSYECPKCGSEKAIRDGGRKDA